MEWRGLYDTKDAAEKEVLKNVRTFDFLFAGAAVKKARLEGAAQPQQEAAGGDPGGEQVVVTGAASVQQPPPQPSAQGDRATRLPCSGLSLNSSMDDRELSAIT